MMLSATWCRRSVHLRSHWGKPLPLREPLPLRGHQDRHEAAEGAVAIVAVLQEKRLARMRP